MRLAIVALTLVMIGCGGCQNFQEASPETHVANARAIYTATVNTMTDLAVQGHLNLEVAETFEAVRVRAAVMLEEADDAILLGTEFNFTDLTSTMASLTAILSIAMKGMGQ